MQLMEQKPRDPPPQSSDGLRRSSTSASSWSRCTNSMKNHARRRRFWCAVAGVSALIAMIVGIVFTAHYYYHLFGGQGFMGGIRSRHWPVSEDARSAPEADLYLPMRQNARMTSRSNKAERTIPFNVCGDQMNSCEAYKHPEICCPVTMVCHKTKYTASGIYCCNATGSGCRTDRSHQPKCLIGLFECSSLLGGGCCRNGWSCAADGCVPPSSTFTSTSSATRITTSTINSMNERSPLESAGNSYGSLRQIEVTTNAASESLLPSRAQIMPSAVSPVATIIQPKTGEVASRGSATETLRQLLLILPGSLLGVLSEMVLIYLIL